MISTKINFYKRLLPLGTAQTLGVFNDNAFKSVLIFTALGLSQEYESNSFFIALMTVIFVAPFIMFAVPAGYFSDKFSKRKVMLISKFSEIIIMLLGALFFYIIPIYGIYPVVLILFLMASQSSAFSPAYNSILPEIFSENEISDANGILGMLTFLAIIIGFAFGIIIKSLVGDSLYLCGLIFSCISVVGFIGALKVQETGISNPLRKWNNNVIQEFKKTLNLIIAKKVVFISILGEAYFYTIGSSIQTVIILFGKFTLKLKSDMELGVLQLFVAFGMALGCYLGGRLSRNKLELGLAPFGAVGMGLFLILLNLFPGSSIDIIVWNSNFELYPNVLCLLVLIGISAGIFVIPLKVCIQERTDIIQRGNILAGVNLFTFSGILLSGVFTYMLTGKYNISDNSNVTQTYLWINKIMFNFTPGTVLLIIAFLTLIIVIYALVINYDFLYRTIVILVTRIVYRVKCGNEKNIPESGAVLLVSNHMTLLDPLIISSCTSRKINFVIHRDYKKYLLLRKLYRESNFIYSSYEELELSYCCNLAKKVLDDGEIVCIFPEGQMTRNGILGSFTPGIEHFFKIKSEFSIIPVYISGLWGSVLSYYYDNIKLRLPKKLFRAVNISIGSPIKDKVSLFKTRQSITELATDFAMLPKKGEKVLHYQFAKRAKKNFFKKIFIDYEGQEFSTFTMFVRSLIISREIRKLGSQEKYIGVLLPNSTGTAATIVGVMMADKTPAILNFTITEDIFNRSMKKANIDIILTSKLFITKANIKHKKEMIFLEDVASKITKSTRLQYFLISLILPSRVLMKLYSPKSYQDLNNNALLLFSSGSSGIPKGVELTHHNLNSNVNSYANIIKCSKKTDIITGNLPVFHSFGASICFWIPLMMGLKVVYLKNPIDAGTNIAAIKKHKLTLLISTPTFLQSYLNKSSSSLDFESVRLVVLGAEKMRKEFADKFYEYCGVRPIEGYGCTELSPVVSVNLPDFIDKKLVGSGKPGSIGKTLPGISAKIIDFNTLEDLEANQEGLLLVRGPNIMKGYLHDLELTEKSIINGWYNTGDIAVIDNDGFITITGRFSRFSKIGGEMISHEFVENAIDRVISAESRVIAVTGIPDKAKGEKLIVFYKQLPMTPDKIIAELRNRGIGNIWIPKKNNFFQIDEIPSLGSGKLDIRGLNELANTY